MQVSKVQGCCSMLTISNNPSLDFFSSKSDFRIKLYQAILEYNSDVPKGKYPIRPNEVKTVILTTNKKRSEMPWWFKKAYSYKGNNKVKATVKEASF